MTLTAAGELRTRLMPQFRVLLNSRCGRACFYCRPSGEGIPTPPATELAVRDLLAVGVAVSSAGISSVKLTGGDPGLYDHLEEAVRRLKAEAGFNDVEVISRHPRIGARAAALASAGVDQFNMSIDTFDRGLHQEICGVDDLPQLLDALRRLVATGIPVKVNVVVMRGLNDIELPSLLARCAELGVTTVKLLDVISDLDEGAETYARRLARRRGLVLRDLYEPLGALLDAMGLDVTREDVLRQGDLGHPMRHLVLSSGMHVLLKDSVMGAWYGDICTGCLYFPCHDALMALRLTPDLRLQFCLLREDIAVDLRKAMNHPDTIREIVHSAIDEYSSARFQGLTSKQPSDAQPVHILSSRTTA